MAAAPGGGRRRGRALGRRAGRPRPRARHEARALVLGAAGLVALFAAFSLFYGKTAITVTREGMIAEGPFRRRPVRFEDVLQVVVRDGPGGRVYAVLTRRGAVYFTSLFSRHRELFELILERAHLRPRHA